MGIETEYGIYAPNDRRTSPELLSAQVVNAYADLVFPDRTDLPQWNYYQETPFSDLREIRSLQFGLDGLPTEFVAPNIPNLMLPNGARLYVDHAHPEFSTPEVTNPMAATLWDLAGEHIMRQAAEQASKLSGNEIVLYKN
ncbi:MAG: proteasome accessory factor PafA2, partial [Actinobacteria bacterium]|nr:proteasome accessory factor PafA2 [Actinomycetota bacterium]